jgi:hypothetical protein
MMVFGLIESNWFGPALWAALYTSDYVLTITCARLYRSQTNVVFEGSYEITPMFQADVNALRRVSPRFLISLVVSTAYIWMVRMLAGLSDGLSGLYAAALGAMLLIQATVHVRHLRNWFLFSRGAGGIEGRVHYKRGFMLQSSAVELLLFTLLYLGLTFATGSLFVFGGALACGCLSLNHYRLARRHEVRIAQVVAQQ